MSPARLHEAQGREYLVLDVPSDVVIYRLDEGMLLAVAAVLPVSALAQKLAQNNRQGCLALKGEIILEVDGQTILVK